MPRSSSYISIYGVTESLHILRKLDGAGSASHLFWGSIVPRRSPVLALMLLLMTPATIRSAAPSAESPAFTTVPELRAGFDLLYEQKFGEARETFATWESGHPEEPFGEAAIAASYLFEELYRENALMSFSLTKSVSSAELTAGRMPSACRISAKQWRGHGNWPGSAKKPTRTTAKPSLR